MRLSFTAAVVACHAGVVVASVFLASWFRFGSLTGATWRNLLERPLLALAVYVALALFIFNVSGLYRFDDRWTLASELVASLKGTFLLGVVTFAALYFLKLEDVSRIFLVVFLSLTWAGTTLTTVAVRSFYTRRRARGVGSRYLLVVGSNPEVIPFLTQLPGNHPELGVSFIGYLGREGSLDARMTHLGPVDDLPEVLANRVIDEVIVAPEAWELSHLDEIVQLAQEQGKTTRIPLPSMGYAIAQGEIETIDGTPLLTVAATSNRHFWLLAKRAFDIIGSLLGLVLLSPVLAAVSVAIRARDGAPILFRQTRVGMHGRQFELLKFRTMIANAEDLKHGLADQNERNGPAFKISNDPRITQTGRFLRRTSLDELPQLWNVLTGSMSLVGPRPPLPEEVVEYDPWHRRRLSMKPGITGLWQVRQRTEPDFDSWVATDLEYIDNWSPLLDSRILLETVPAVFRSTGD